MKKTINNNLIKRQGGTDRTQLLIFTDLDGTLLDHYTYSFDPAQEALKKIRAAKIPLIICTSKTRAEIEVWREKLNNNDPFISENGGAIFFPNEGGASDLKKCLDDHDRYDIVELGMPYSELIIHFRRLKGIFEERIRGFSEMDASEVARLTGLPTEEAELAMRREYTEPFIFDGDEAGIKRLQESVQTLRLTLTRGGRFFHLLGGNDKGKAVRIVTERYKRSFIRVRSLAIGDSYNDLPMLKEADIAVLVQKPGGFYDESIANLPNLVRAPGVGPEGWNRAVLEILGQ